MKRHVSTGLIQIQVNGRSRDVRPGQTLAGLLDELGLDRRTMVVELNRRIVRRSELGETTLKADDTVELVHFVGGG